MADESERELIERHLAGDPSAFDRLFEMHHRRVANLACQILRDEDAAIDAAQETFLRAFNELEKWRGEARLSTWLYRTTLNVCFERMRAEEKQRKLREAGPPAAEAASPPEEDACASELRQAADRAIRSLPPQQRSIFVLKQYHDLKFSEIAGLLGISEGGAKASYH
ncbi:MAG: RNA polymerase sigma factor, partial [Planctomycetota bacterium]|nr:RNA polymerase sigma factor [Planctomycetota bacterium]